MIEREDDYNSDEIDLGFDEDEEESPLWTTVDIPSSPQTQSDLELLLYRTLKKYWGYDHFRKHQLEICKAILEEKRDCFFMMSTGSGKSLVFQLPAVALREGGRKCCTLVISPLISLMEDQVASLLAMGINACAIGAKYDKKIEDAAILGNYALIYATPEKILLWQRGLEQLQRNCEIISIAIDESHCVSEWGSDFRPEYSLLHSLRDWLGHTIPIVALTASATMHVQHEIVTNLSLKNPLIIRDTVNRPNLKYVVCPKRMNSEIVRCILDSRLSLYAEMNGLEIEKTPSIGSHMENVPFPSTLIYVNSKKKAEDIARELVECSLLKGIRAAYYHSGISNDDRDAVHRAFLCDDIQVVVATTAFGMGINKPDIRLVVHYGLPLSIESYYQQTGRAGRDGLPSKCLLFWDSQDIRLCNNLISSSSKPSSHSSSNSTPNTSQPSTLRLLKMDNFVRQIKGCRRVMILEYFQESAASIPIPPTEGCCDLCDQALQARRKDHLHQEYPFHQKTDLSSFDISEEVYMLLSVFFETRSFFGISVVIALLLGKNDKNVQRIPSYQTVDFYGKGVHHSSDWWKALADQLSDHDQYLEKSLIRSASGYSFFKYILTPTAMFYLTGQRVLQYDKGSLLLKRLPFNHPGHHSYKASIHTDLLKLIQAEKKLLVLRENILLEQEQQKKATLLLHHPHHITDPRKPTSSSTTTTLSLPLYLYKERLEFENTIKNVRKQISVELQIAPYQLLSSTEIIQLMKFSFLQSECLGGGHGTCKQWLSLLPRTANELMELLKWMDWKRLHATKIIQRLTGLASEQPLPLKSIEAIESKEAEEDDDDDSDCITIPNDDIFEDQGTSDTTNTRPNDPTHHSNTSFERNSFLYYPNYAAPSSREVIQPQNTASNQSITVDDNDSDATCIEDSPVLISRKRGFSSINDTTNDVQSSRSTISSEEDDRKENTLNRSSTIDSSAALKAQRKRLSFAGIASK